MRKGAGVIAAAALTSFALVGATSASASTEVGDDCQANDAAANHTFVPLSSTGTLPISVPSSGVITRWRVSSAETGSFVERLLVLRPTGNANEFRVVGESAPATILPGVNTVDTRIPTEAGDRLGVYGSTAGSGTLYCSTGNGGDQLGDFDSEAPFGSVQTFIPTPGSSVPVSGIVEPDADGDGYGDETQDRCPQSATFQIECPLIRLDALAIPKKKLILVLVATSYTAPVDVYGQVKWGFKPKPKGTKHRAAHRARRHKAKLIVGLSGGPTQTVFGGAIARFKVRLPRTVQRRLRRTSRKRTLRGKLTVSATNLAGVVTKDRVGVRVKGWKRP